MEMGYQHSYVNRGDSGVLKSKTEINMEGTKYFGNAKLGTGTVIECNRDKLM